MSDWRVELAPGLEGRPLVVEVLHAQAIWRKLTKPARAAVEAAYPDKAVRGHWRTHEALTRHGFVAWDNTAQACTLTEAGKAVAKWCVKP